MKTRRRQVYERKRINRIRRAMMVPRTWLSPVYPKQSHGRRSGYFSRRAWRHVLSAASDLIECICYAA